MEEFKLKNLKIIFNIILKVISISISDSVEITESLFNLIFKKKIFNYLTNLLIIVHLI